jgi:hypothetical protein
VSLHEPAGRGSSRVGSESSQVQVFTGESGWRPRPSHCTYGGSVRPARPLFGGSARPLFACTLATNRIQVPSLPYKSCFRFQVVAVLADIRVMARFLHPRPCMPRRRPCFTRPAGPARAGSFAYSGRLIAAGASGDATKTAVGDGRCGESESGSPDSDVGTVFFSLASLSSLDRKAVSTCLFHYTRMRTEQACPASQGCLQPIQIRLPESEKNLKVYIRGSIVSTGREDADVDGA